MKYLVTVTGEDGVVVLDLETNDPGQVAQRAAEEFLKRAFYSSKSVVSFTVKIEQISGGGDT